MHWFLLNGYLTKPKLKRSVNTYLWKTGKSRCSRPTILLHRNKSKLPVGFKGYLRPVSREVFPGLLTCSENPYNHLKQFANLPGGLSAQLADLRKAPIAPFVDGFLFVAMGFYADELLNFFCR